MPSNNCRAFFVRLLFDWALCIKEHVEIQNLQILGSDWPIIVYAAVASRLLGIPLFSYTFLYPEICGFRRSFVRRITCVTTDFRRAMIESTGSHCGLVDWTRLFIVFRYVSVSGCTEGISERPSGLFEILRNPKTSLPTYVTGDWPRATDPCSTVRVTLRAAV